MTPPEPTTSGGRRTGMGTPVRQVGPITLALASLVLVGCAQQQSPGATPTTTPHPSASPSGGTSLTITVREAPTAAPQSWTLTCNPPGGTHPDPAAACAQLAALPAPFAPTPKGMACTQIYGGPQTATVTGTYRGQPVDARFSRTDGCEISRWDRVSAVLVIAPGA